MKRHAALFGLLALLPLATLADDPIVVTKSAGKSNPTLLLKSFVGKDAVRRQLLNDLDYSDWFEVVQQPPSDYVLTAVHTEALAGRAIEITLADGAGKSIARFRQQTTAEARWLVHGAVDAVIRAAFDNPGFCSTQVAFVKARGGDKEVWVADFDGGNANQLTFNRRLSVEPDWGSGNRYLVYTMYNRFSTDVVLIDREQHRHKRLAAFPGLNAGAALSGDNRQVALTLSRDGQVDLYVMDLAGGKPKRLTNSAGVEASPCWSPDNKTLCYVSDSASTHPTLYLMPSKGGQARRLLKLPEEAVSPDWSPVSNKVCLALRQGGKYAIAVLNMTRKNPVPRLVTKAAGDWESPSWAADGRHIVCSRTQGDKRSLYLVDSLYGKLRALKQSGGEDSLPAYSTGR